MAIIDRHKTYRAIEERLARTDNPRHRLLLEKVLQHARGEVLEDLDMVLDTLCDKPVYRIWNGGPEMNPQGMEAVRQFYIDEIFGTGKHFLEFSVDRIVVDDDTVVTDGHLKTVMWGRDLETMGMAVEDADGTYLVEYRNLISWPFDKAGDIIGEESYASRPKVSRIANEDVPEDFRAYLESRTQAA